MFVSRKIKPVLAFFLIMVMFEDVAMATASCSSEQKQQIAIRIAAYNVKQGSEGSARQIGKMLQRFKPDIIGFSEVPGGNWTLEAGKVLGMKYAYVGKISSAHHVNKYKSILSRTPLFNTREFELQSGDSWKPASAVRAETTVRGVELAFYSMHIARSSGKEGQAYEFVSKVFPEETNSRIILTGDFNNETNQSGLKNFMKSGFVPVWSDVGFKLRWKSSVVKRSKIGVIDHIFYNKTSGAKATVAGVVNLKKALSDHKPVVAEIQFPFLCITGGRREE